MSEKKKPTIRETLDAVWEAGGKAWDDVKDPDAVIREMRGYPPAPTNPEPIANAAGEIKAAYNLLREWINRAGRFTTDADRALKALDILMARSAAPPAAVTEGEIELIQESRDVLDVWADIHDEPCRYDHNNFCQEHISGHPCIVERTKAALAKCDEALAKSPAPTPAATEPTTEASRKDGR